MPNRKPWHTDAYFKDLERFSTRKGRSFHHFHYDHLKHRQSIYWVDGVFLPKWLHVPVVHRLLGGGSRAKTQRFGAFPNAAQRLAHWLFRFAALLTMPLDSMVPISSRFAAVFVVVAALKLALSIWPISALR